MFNQRIFDAIQAQIECGHAERGLHILIGTMLSAEAGAAARTALSEHSLHSLLMEDPYSWRAAAKPRGYAGDAMLIDLIYDRQAPEQTSSVGRKLFDITTAFPPAEAVRYRRSIMEEKLAKAFLQGKRICSLACGHFREGDQLIGEDLRTITLVDQDAHSLAYIEGNHGGNVHVVEANVLRYLRSAASQGIKFDLIYTLGLTDYLDDRAMRLLHKLMRACLAPGGQIFLANFVPDHLARGWMDAVMDWHLIYRTEDELRAHACAIDLEPQTWLDPSRSIAFCEMS
jgi:extracellular factor (EF) 3-hydroxypalmitic acid methyl ester biosynthesis protein